LDPKSDEWEVFGDPEGMPAGNVQFVTPDSNGTAWLGFWDGPLYCFDGEQWGEFAGSGQIQADEVRAVSVAPDKSVWFATSNGAYQWDRKTDVWRHYTEADGLYSNVVTDILFTPDGKVWFVTSRGVGYLEHAKVIGTAEQGPFGAATTSEDGKVWFDGELYFDSVSQSWADTVYRPSAHAYDIAVDGRGGLWVATDDGALYIPDPEKSLPEEWQRFTHANGLGGKRIRSLAAAEDGTIWFGSEIAIVSRCTFGQ